MVASLIDILKNTGQNGMLVYFSDHGEEVYDHPEKLFAGRNEGAPTSNMYTIPFIVWRSDSWAKSNVIHNPDRIVHRIYSTSDFIYTWAELAGIRFDGFDASKSVIAEEFQSHPIWIGDPSVPSRLRDLRKQLFLDIEIKNNTHISGS